MPVHEEIMGWAWILAVAAGSNWAYGNRSAFGRSLILRSGGFWRVARWSGLVVFLSVVALWAGMDGGNRTLAVVALVGAFSMLFGTARKRARSAPPNPTTRGVETDGQAPNP